jgi:hypothetical protein
MAIGTMIKKYGLWQNDKTGFAGLLDFVFAPGAFFPMAQCPKNQTYCPQDILYNFRFRNQCRDIPYLFPGAGSEEACPQYMGHFVL